MRFKVFSDEIVNKDGKEYEEVLATKVIEQESIRSSVSNVRLNKELWIECLSNKMTYNNENIEIPETFYRSIDLPTHLFTNKISVKQLNKETYLLKNAEELMTNAVKGLNKLEQVNVDEFNYARICKICENYYCDLLVHSDEENSIEGLNLFKFDGVKQTVSVGIGNQTRISNSFRTYIGIKYSNGIPKFIFVFLDPYHLAIGFGDSYTDKLYRQKDNYQKNRYFKDHIGEIFRLSLNNEFKSSFT